MLKEEIIYMGFFSCLSDELLFEHFSLMLHS